MLQLLRRETFKIFYFYYVCFFFCFVLNVLKDLVPRNIIAFEASVTIYKSAFFIVVLNKMKAIKV